MDDMLHRLIMFLTQIIQVIILAAGCYFWGVSVYGWKRKKEKPAYAVPRKRFAAVIAAHNEELVIAHIIDSLQEQNYPRELFDIFVIADNCTDNTASIAARQGAQVYVRSDNDRSGKGHALEWMFRKIYEMGDKYDAVCVFDADNLVSSNFLYEMNKQLCKGHNVIQGYIDSKNPFDSWITCSYSIAFWLSNRIFQLQGITWDSAAVCAARDFVWTCQF